MRTVSVKLPPEHADALQRAGAPSEVLRTLVARWVADREDAAAVAAYRAQPDDDAVTADEWPADLDDGTGEW